jgi:serine/threonine-protein kinase
MLRPEMWSNVDVRERFEREAKFSDLLRGEHFVRVFESGRLDSGLPFLVMERLEGMDLADLLRCCSPLAVSVAVDYVMQACAGLSAAHVAGLVHRDVKPGNLFLASNRGAAPRIRLLDFGIAEPLEGSVASLPKSGELLGSPAYVAPEQMEAPCRVDVRTDIWSVGVVCFELLTGQSPFQRANTTGTCWSVLLHPIPDLRKVRPDVDVALEAIVRRCLQRNPARRFSSVRELRDALRPFAAGRPSWAAASAVGESRPRRRRALQPTAVGLSA